MSELFKICRESKTSKVLSTEQLSSDLVNVGVTAGFDMDFLVKKSRSIIISTAQRLTYQKMSKLFIRVDDEIIQNVSSFRLLGVEVDDRLSWSKHIDYLIGKINLRLRIFYRISKFLPFSAKLTYYHSFIGTHLDYCSTVWGRAAACEIKRLTRLQNRSARAITGVEYNSSSYSSVSSLHSKLKWLLPS